MASFIDTHTCKRFCSARASVLGLLSLVVLIGVTTSPGGSPADSDTLLQETEIEDLEADPTAEQVVTKLNAARVGILKFRITPSLFGEKVQHATRFDAFITANQRPGGELAYFHDLGKGTVQIYTPERDAIETSIPLSESHWPTLQVALGLSVHTGPSGATQRWPARYEAGTVRVNGTAAFNKFVGDLVENLRKTELPEVLVFPLKYATASDTSIALGGSSTDVKPITSEGVKKQLERFLYGAVNGSGNKILAHKKQNAIIIVDRPEMRPYYQEIIDKLDVERELVEITAAIIDIEATTGLEWQSQFVAAGMERENSKERYAAGLGVGDDFFDDSGPVDLPPLDLVNNTGLNVATMLVGSNYRVISKVRALEQTGKAKLMSRPSVLTIENQPARITDTVTVFVPIRGERQSQLYDITSGISLTVLPRIVDKGDAGKGGRRVYLAIDVGDGDVGTGGDAASASQKKNRITTQTILRDGESLLIGGRYINQQSESDSGVPILKKIPVLGLPFKDKTVQNGRLQRLYLITPKILTWREAQLREQEAAAMLAEADIADLASVAEAAAVASGDSSEFSDPADTLPDNDPGAGAEEPDEPDAPRRGLFQGRIIRRLRGR